MDVRRVFLGLYSGLAADGIDAAVISIDGAGDGVSVRQEGQLHRPFDATTAGRIRLLASGRKHPIAEIDRLRRDVTSLAADAAREMMARVDLAPTAISGVGFAGQRLSADGFLDAGGALARLVDCPVAHGFAPSDFDRADWILLRHERLSRAAVHLGAVATLSFVPADADVRDVESWDVGPGTLLSDELMQRLHQKPCDADGAVAAGGRFCGALLNELKAHPYFSQEPPKRLDPAVWSGAYVDRLFLMAEKHGVGSPELVTAVTDLAAETVAAAVGSLTERPHEIILSGGGARNIHLAGCIRKLLSPSSTYTCEKYGFGLQSKQAVAAAVLAALRLDGLPCGSLALPGRS